MKEAYRNTCLDDLDGEFWSPIKGYDGYEISQFGRVKSTLCFFKKKGIRILKQGIDNYGYPMVVLMKEKNRFTKTVHRLVATTFIPNPLNKPEINHKFGIKTDNRVSQLEWATTSENVQHAYDVLGRKGYSTNGGLFGELNWNSKKVAQIDIKTGEILAEFHGTAEAARCLNISRRGIGKAAQGMRATYKGFKWKYL